MSSDFKIQIPITRAYKNAAGEMLFEGTASSTSVDSHETIFNEACQASFAADIADGIARGEPVELESEHNGDLEPFNILGPVISAEVIDGNKLKIIGRLDPDNAKAVYYFKKMTIEDPVTKRVKQYGLSINGSVVTAHFELNKELNKTIRVFDRVVLKRVGIVRKPSNPDSWIEKMIRSVEWDNVETVHMDDAKIEIKERSEIEMSNEANIEVTSDSVIAEVEAVVAEVAREESESSEEATPETETEAVVEPVEAVEEVAAEVEEVAPVEEAAAVVEEVTATEEVLDRTSYWTSGRLMSSMGSVLSAVCELEDLARYDSEDLNVGMTEDAIATAKECFGKLQSILGQHVNMPSEARAQEAHEDLSDVVTEVAHAPEVEVEAVEVTPDPELSRVEAVAVDNTALVAEVLAAVVGYMDAEFTDNLNRKFTETMNAFVAEKIGENNLESAKEKDELVRKLEDVEKANTELLTRLEKVEQEPASRPGMQLLDSITRNESQTTQRDLNIAKAKAESNSQELILHRMFPTTYIGYGEYTVK